MLFMARASNTLARFTNSADYGELGAEVLNYMAAESAKRSLVAARLHLGSSFPNSVCFTRFHSPQSWPDFINCLLIYYGGMCVVCCIQFIQCCTAYNRLYIQIQIIPQIYTIHYFSFFTFLTFRFDFFWLMLCIHATRYTPRHSITSPRASQMHFFLYMCNTPATFEYTKRCNMLYCALLHICVLTFSAGTGKC